MEIGWEDDQRSSWRGCLNRNFEYYLPAFQPSNKDNQDLSDEHDFAQFTHMNCTNQNNNVAARIIMLKSFYRANREAEKINKSQWWHRFHLEHCFAIRTNFQINSLISG